MGLDTTHGAWHGAYSSFNDWRRRVAELAGFPPLNEMLGFGNVPADGTHGTKSWDDLPATADKRLVPLLNHSDCDGDLTPKECSEIADALEALLPKFVTEGPVDRWHKADTMRFIEGCRAAAQADEVLMFQ